MKLKTLLHTATAAFLFAAIPVAGVDGASSVPAISTLSATAQATRLAALKTRGAAEIERRIANLNSALTKLTASTKLTAADKAALTQQVQAELTALAALGTKLGGDTDLATARTDVQSIVTEYRVYVLMLPKTRLVASVDRFSVAESKLTALAAKLQSAADAAKTAGHDVTAIQAGIADLTAKDADATSKTAGIVPQLLALTPDQYDANHSLLAPYRQTLAAAQVDIKAARDDAQSAITALTALK